MGPTTRQWFIALAAAAFLATTGCKSEGSFEEHEKTAGEEVEAAEEHGDTAIDDADEADDYQPASGGQSGDE